MDLQLQIFRETPDAKEDERVEAKQMAQLMRVHRNLGHPSNKLYVKILREARAPESVIKVAEQLRCPICDRFAQAKPSRPANPQRARELGECVAIDFSYHTMPNGKKVPGCKYD